MKDLAHLYNQLPSGLIAVQLFKPRTKKQPVTHFFPVNDIPAIEEFSLKHAQDFNVYFGFHVLSQRPATGRGTAQDFGASPGLFLDIDIRQDEAGIHAAGERLPASLEEVRETLREAGLPEPTSIVNSGNGYYFRYLFPEPIVYATDEERRAFEHASLGFHSRASKAFAAKGWKLDNVADLPRITRMPGTLNHKTMPPKLVELVEHAPDRTLSREDFFRCAANVPAKRKAGNLAKTTPEETEADVNSDSASANFVPIQAACRVVRRWVENAVDQTYPEWFALAGILKHCQDGEQIFHQVSRKDSRYDEDEASAVFGNATGPTSCRHIGLELGCGECAKCPFAGNRHVGSPIAFGDLTHAVAQLMANFAYVVHRERFVRLDTKVGLTKVNLTDSFIRYVDKPVQTLLSDKRTRIVDHTGFFPGRNELFVEDEGEMALNIWRPSDLQPMPGDTSIILDHFEYLIPVEEERRHVLDVLAHSVQNPSLKIGHCLFFIGAQGTGKSWLSDLLRQLFGSHNVFVAENQTLTSSFNAPLGDRQVLVLEEVGLADKAEAYNSLKVWVTDEKVIVNEKHEPRYPAATPRLMLAYSNRELPLKIESSDRRFMFVQSPDMPQDRTYYARLFSEGLDQAGAFLRWLLDRDIRHFSPKAHPPMTATKQRIIDESKTAVAREIEAMVAQNEWPLNQELFTLYDLMSEIRDRVSGSVNTSVQEFTRVLKRFGYVQATTNQIRMDGFRYRFWAKAGSPLIGSSPELLKRQWQKQDQAA